MENSPNDGPIQGQDDWQYRWAGASSIGLAQQLNAEFIDLLCELSLEPAADNPFELVTIHRDLWNRLDLMSRKHLSYFPFVIVDLRFGDVAWWRMLAESCGARAPTRSAAAPATWIEGLVLETLMFAWQVAREDRDAALMLFAMPRSVADCIAGLSMQQVRTLVSDCTSALRIRWENDRKFWRELLIAAKDNDQAALQELGHKAKLHFGGELAHIEPTDGASNSFDREP
jgi:hypothetical protein